jgi:anti-sigma factor RsiW
VTALSCSELVELVTDYLEGALPRQERMAFEAHISSCPPCREYLVQMRQTIARLGSLPEESLEPQARENLLRTFRNWRRD